MLHSRVSALILLSLLCLPAFIPSCGGKSGLGESDSPAQPEALKASSEGFELVVSPDSFAVGGSLQDVRLDIGREEDGSIRADVIAENASKLRALYFSLAYDTESMHAVEGIVSEEFSAGSELLSLSVLDAADGVHHGQILAHPQQQDGFSGNGVLASIRFAPGAAGKLRRSSVAPTGPGSRSDISYELNTTYGLFWHYYNQGDYDQNSEVNISDLTPLGINLKKLGPFGPATILGMVDGDGNGEINLADITPIGANFGARVSSYNLYASDNFEDYPADNGPSTIEPYATKDFHDYQLPDANNHAGPLPKEGRLFYMGEIISQPQGQQDYNYYWVRPSDGVEEGMPSYVLASPRYLSNPSKLQPPVVSFDDIQGVGIYTDPYVAAQGAEIKVTVMDPVLGDISTHPDMRYRFVTENGTPWPHASISNTDAILRIDPAAPTDEGILHLQFFSFIARFRGRHF